eukprot:scaffold527_cov368-Prasinococcus_capsulatus_cf.AAC.4
MTAYDVLGQAGHDALSWLLYRDHYRERIDAEQPGHRCPRIWIACRTGLPLLLREEGSGLAHHLPRIVQSHPKGESRARVGQPGANTPGAGPRVQTAPLTYAPSQPLQARPARTRA